MKLWLDDVRDPVRFGAIGFVWAKTAEEAIAHLRTGEVTFASLDHDLTIEQTIGTGWPTHEACGYDVVCWMEEHGVWPRDGVSVHSMNPAGRARMESVLRKHGVLRACRPAA